MLALAKEERDSEFLGFDFRRARTRSGKWRPQIRPAPEEAHGARVRRALKEHLPTVSIAACPSRRDRVDQSDAFRGWVTYFANGHSTRCFGYVQDWVEKKVRRHLMRARKRQGFGWTQVE